MNYLIKITFLVAIGFSGCQHSYKTPGPIAEEVSAELPVELQKVLDAHGGLDKWQAMHALTYEFQRGDRKEIHKIDLKNRKVLLDGGQWQIGFDGKEVWVSPNKQAYGGNSARFYHNLIFYFYAMPFVLADPGITYEVMEPAEISGKKYNKLRITYYEGVGDAPDDEYILCSDPETNKMEWLLYTVTYFSGEPAKSYNALHYNKWKEVDGLLLPVEMSGYKTEGDSITEKRYESLFSQITLTDKAFDQDLFDMPDQAEIDSLK